MVASTKISKPLRTIGAEARCGYRCGNGAERVLTKDSCGVEVEHSNPLRTLGAEGVLTAGAEPVLLFCLLVLERCGEWAAPLPHHTSV